MGSLLLCTRSLGLTIGAGLTQEVGKERKLGAGNLRTRIGGQASLILAPEPLQGNVVYSGLRVGKGPCLMVDGAPGCGAGDAMLFDYVVAGIQTARTGGIAVCKLCGAAGSPRVAVRRSRNRTLIFGHQVQPIPWCCEAGAPNATLRTALDAAQTEVPRPGTTT